MADERKGKLIVLEGTDGSGKTEQFNKLLLRLPPEVRFKSIDFPRYSDPAAYFVENYLRGHYGDAVGPKLASIFYALDRFDSALSIRKWLEEGKVVISNRYTGSNMGHQGAKIESAEERKKLFSWLYELEYELCEIPKPDLNIILHVPAEVAYELIEKKASRAYLKGAKRDIHEANLEHLKSAERSYLEMAQLFPNDFVLVECTENGKLLSIEEIHEKVWAIVKKALNL